MIIENKPKSSFTPVASGLHLARCYRIIDLGTQKSEFDGNVKFLRKLKVCWEVFGEDDNGNPLCTASGEPLVITKDYTLSWADKATLRIDLQSWRGKPFTVEEQRRFDLKTVLDKWCMLNVAHKAKKTGDGVYANIVAITPVPNAVKSAGLPDGHNPAQMFEISNPDMAMFETFSDFLKKQISDSPEWKAQGKKSGSGFDDMPNDLDEEDLPF